MDASTRSSNPARLDVDALTGLIIQQASHGKPLHICVDGINECKEPEILLDALEKVLCSTTQVHLLASSIDEVAIQKRLMSMPLLRQIALSPIRIKQDVILLIHSVLEKHAKMKNLPAELKREIFTSLADEAQGM